MQALWPHLDKAPGKGPSAMSQLQERILEQGKAEGEGQAVRAHQLLEHYLHGNKLSQEQLERLLNSSLKELNKALGLVRQLRKGQVFVS